jgi:hypothetical protein
MKIFRRSLAVALLLTSLAGFQSTTTSAASATVAPPVHNVTGCCYVFYYGKWYCVPC